MAKIHKLISRALVALIALVAFGFAQEGLRPIKSPVYNSIDGNSVSQFTPAGVIKWEETFNTTTVPSDWQVIDNDGSGGAWAFVQQLNYTGGTVVPHAGQSFWFSSFQNANPGGLIDEWLISPQLPMIEAGDSLHFFAGAIGGLYPDSLKVLISTTTPAPANFTEIAYFYVPGPIGNWTKFSFDMTPFAGSQIYVAVNYYIVDGGPAGTNSDNVWVDHFILEGQGASTARLQVIHNAADPAAALVDIYVNDALLLDDFAFRAATPFIDVPAGVTLNIGVAPGNSTSVNDTLVNIPVVLPAGGTFAAIANGVLNPANFAPNPDGISTAFQLLVQPMARETGSGAGVDFYAVHGSTDAPTVDIVARGVGTLLNNVPYTAVSSYLTVPAASYIIDVADSSGSVVVASFAADLSTLGGGAAAVIASGFLNPANNQNGPAFGLIAVLPDGAVIELPALATARLQMIHNAADPAASVVDVYLNGGLLLDDFAFRTATPFIDAPAGVPLNIGVAPGNSTSANDTLKNFVATLSGGGTYVAAANGVLNPAQFAPNPDGRSTAFTLFINADAQETGTGSNADFAVLHGSSDAPTVDVVARNVGTLVNDAAYGDFTDYLSVPAVDYTIDIKDASGTVTVASYSAPLGTLGLNGSALVVYASGFFDPSANQNGPGFGLYVTLPAGGPAIALPAVPVGINDATPAVVKEFELFQNYPNPFNPSTTISFALPTAEEVTVRVFNLLGQEVATVVNGRRFEVGVHRLNFDAASLVSGVYFYRIEAGNFQAIKKMVLMK